MVLRRKYSNIGKWEVSRLVEACDRNSDSKEIIYVPEYQRRLVWDRDKQKGLINSIKMGYPFGSLLLYEDNEKEGKRKYDLIDGLQRTYAIQEYMQNPNQFFYAEDVDFDIVDLVVEELQLKGEERSEIVRKTLSGWVRSRKGFDETEGWNIDELVKRIVVEAMGICEESSEFRGAFADISLNDILANRLKRFLADVRTEADIGDAELPIIIYSGDIGNLPEIFTLLNSTGVALSPYDVYAASWLKYRLRIDEQEIKDAVRKRYEALEEGGFTSAAIEFEDNEEDESGREYSLFEFLFGFGQYLTKSFPYLFSPVEADKPSSIGFNLVTACIGMRLSDMKHLDQRLHERKYDLNRLGKQIYECVNHVDQSLEHILRVNERGRKRAIAIFHTEFHIISIIASVFQVKYDPFTLETRRDWKKPLSNLKSKLQLYYLYDIIRDHWRGSGDSKLFDDVANQRFSRRLPSCIHWRSMFEIWFEEKQISMLHKRRNVRKASPEILFLKYIYVKRFTLYEGAKAYHVEHIVPVDRLVKQVKESGEGWPINCVANLALLEQQENQRKGRKTFIEYRDDQLKRDKIAQQDYEGLVRSDEKMLICPREILPNNAQQINRHDYERFLRNRFEELVTEFLTSWNDLIPSS